jgi:hypothetical protein
VQLAGLSLLTVAYWYWSSMCSWQMHEILSCLISSFGLDTDAQMRSFITPSNEQCQYHSYFQTYPVPLMAGTLGAKLVNWDLAPRCAWWAFRDDATAETRANFAGREGTTLMETIEYLTVFDMFFVLR